MATIYNNSFFEYVDGTPLPDPNTDSIMMRAAVNHIERLLDKKQSAMGPECKKIEDKIRELCELNNLNADKYLQEG